MPYSLKLVKSYSDFLNEAAGDPPSKLKIVRQSYTEQELEKLNKQAYDYLISVFASLKEDESFKDMKGIQIILKKTKPMIGLTAEQANALNEKFKTSEDLLFGTAPEDFNTVYIEKKEFKEILADKEGAELKKQYDELQAKIVEWNAANATIFKFANNVSDKVNNPDESNKALQALKTILDGYAKIAKSVSIQLVGHTSSPGDPALNQKLSDGRAATVKNMLVAILPGLNITSVGKGETELVEKDDATDEAKQQKNRRVEVKISAEAAPVVNDTVKVTYNVVVYGFELLELDTPPGTGTPPKAKVPNVKNYKPKFKKLNPKKGIPCPHFK